jgi:hypothetical protein
MNPIDWTGGSENKYIAWGAAKEVFDGNQAKVQQ